MKYLKIVGLATVAAAALMAFIGAGEASATTLLLRDDESPCAGVNTYEATTKVHGGLRGRGDLQKPRSRRSNANRQSKAKSTKHRTLPAQPKAISSLSPLPTALPVHECDGAEKWRRQLRHARSAHRKSRQQRQRHTDSLQCRMDLRLQRRPFAPWAPAAAGTDLGEITVGAEATMDIDATVKYRGDSTNFICTAGVKWEGTYKATSPKLLFVI